MITNARPLSVVEVLQKLDDGGVVEEIREKIAEVSDAVINTGKNGKITITLDFKKSKKKALVITDKITATIPKEDRDPTTFYVKNGALHRDNPDQMDMAMEEEGV